MMISTCLRWVLLEESMMPNLNRRRFVAVGGAAGMGLLATSMPALAAETTPGRSAPKYQLGTVTYNIAAQWDIPTLLRICKAAGLAAVELRTTHKHGVEPSLSPSQRAEVRKQFQNSGVVLWGLGSVCEFQSTDPKVVAENIETCKQFLQLSADVGGRGVKVRPNGLPKDVPVGKTLEQIGKALIPCGRTAADLNQEVWVEVHGGGTAHPPHMKAIMEHCGLANVGITWNSNPTDLKDGSIVEHFHLLRPWLKSCHINELHSSYPWRSLFTLLKETGYDRYTLAEIPGMPDPASGERLMRYYRALWTELTR
jgi:sugar phosphate isomerase/epimerase